MLGVGLGSAVAGLTKSLATQIVLNTIGSAAIGGIVTYLGNILRGECDLGKNVIEAAVLSGLLGGSGSYIGAKLSSGIRSYIASRDTYRILKTPIESRMRLYHAHTVTQPVSRKPPPIAWGAALGNAAGIILSNAGPMINFFSQIVKLVIFVLLNRDVHVDDLYGFIVLAQKEG